MTICRGLTVPSRLLILMSTMVACASASMGAAAMGRPALNSFPSWRTAMLRETPDVHRHDAMEEEIPGTRPFSPEPPEQFSDQLRETVETADGGSSVRLPPSSQWEGALVPEWNSLAHMKLLSELGGRMPREVEQRAHSEFSQPTPLLQAKLNAEPSAVRALHSPKTPQASDPWQAFGSPSRGLVDHMTPFGAPIGFDAGYSGEKGGSGFFYPPPVDLPQPFYQAHKNAAAGNCAEGRLVTQEQRVVGYTHVDEVGDEEQQRTQLLLRWKQVAKSERKGSLQPIQRVDAKVRGYASRARYAAGIADVGGDLSGAGAGGGVHDKDKASAQTHAATSFKTHAEAPCMLQGAHEWRGQAEDGEGTCAGSPVSSTWSQDPCGYWVQDGWGGGDEPPPHLDLVNSGYWPDVRRAGTQTQASTFATPGDLSSGDLWSTVEAEDADTSVSSHHLELEAMACGHDSVLPHLGMRASGSSATKLGQFCDQFVPRPLQIEFARELHWFAWQGFEENQKTASKQVDMPASTPAPDKTPPRHSKAHSRKLEHKPDKLPFPLPVPLWRSLNAATSLPLTSLRLRATSHDHHIQDGVEDGDDDGDTEMQRHGHGPPDLQQAGYTGNEAMRSNADADVQMTHTTQTRGHVSQKCSYQAKRVLRKGSERSSSLRSSSCFASAVSRSDSASRILAHRSVSSEVSSQAASRNKLRSQAPPAHAPSEILSANSPSFSTCAPFVHVPSSVSPGSEGSARSAASQSTASAIKRVAENEVGVPSVPSIGEQSGVDGGMESGVENGLQSGAWLHRGSTSRLDEIQMFKIQEMLREMHCLLVTQKIPSLVGDRLGGTDWADWSSHWNSRPGAASSGDGSPDSRDGVMWRWRLIMYDAMMHAQSQVAASGHASVKDGIAILDRMAAAGVKPTLRTFNKYLAVVAGAASHGNGNGTHVDDVLVRMAHAGIQPDRETYWAWLSVLGSAVFHGQATMEQVYWAIQNMAQCCNTPCAPSTATTCAPSTAVDGPEGPEGMPTGVVHDAAGTGRVEEDIQCLHLCLRAAVGGAARGLAGKADVEWVLRRLRSLQIEADDDTWVLAMQVLGNAAQRGHASVADAERLLDKAEASRHKAGRIASAAVHCAFFEAAAAAAQSRKNKYAVDARERLLSRLERLERLCLSASSQSPLEHALLPLTRAVRAYVDDGFQVKSVNGACGSVQACAPVALGQGWRAPHCST